MALVGAMPVPELYDTCLEAIRCPACRNCSPRWPRYLSSAAGRIEIAASLSNPDPGRAFRVTELDAYLNCPYDYYITGSSGIRPLEEVTEDMSPA